MVIVGGHNNNDISNNNFECTICFTCIKGAARNVCLIPSGEIRMPACLPALYSSKGDKRPRWAE